MWTNGMQQIMTSQMKDAMVWKAFDYMKLLTFKYCSITLYLEKQQI